MLKTNIEEAKSAFAAAKNLNAALKNCLKKEVQANAQFVGFTKSFRAAVATGREQSVNFFIEKNFPNHEIELLLVARYAHLEFITKNVESIVVQFGEQFNATYEGGESSISIKDKTKFTSIVKEVSSLVDSALNEAGLPVNNFMKNSFLISIFEENVLKEVFPVLQ